MANIFELMRPTERFKQLAEDLDGSLSLIAFAGKADDLVWIRERQRSLRKEYEPLFRELRNDDGWIDLGDYTPKSLVYEAYENFMELGVMCKGVQWGRFPLKEKRRLKQKARNYDPKVLEEEAADILYEHLVLPNPYDFGEPERSILIAKYAGNHKLAEELEEKACL